jgi:uncharacterized protein (DUF488 family)
MDSRGRQPCTEMQPEVTILTIGHSTRSLDELIRLLQAYRVDLLADVRTVPRSRRNPQFNRDTLPAALHQVGISYVHLPALGGLRRPRPDSPNTGWENEGFRGYADYMQTPQFEAGLQELLDLARQSQAAIMCAEAVPWRCHRSLIADALVVRGVSVEHILSETRRQKHVLTPWAVVRDGRLYYPRASLCPKLFTEQAAEGESPLPGNADRRRTQSQASELT